MAISSWVLVRTVAELAHTKGVLSYRRYQVTLRLARIRWDPLSEEGQAQKRLDLWWVNKCGVQKYIVRGLNTTT